MYRRTWSVCPARKYLQEIAHKDELIPNFQLCVKDVTSEYVSNSDVNIEIEAPNHRIGYLCVSERGEWIPIIAAEIKKNRLATFQNMGQNVMYLPAVYENKRIKPAGSPFYINIHRQYLSNTSPIYQTQHSSIGKISLFFIYSSSCL